MSRLGGPVSRRPGGRGAVSIVVAAVSGWIVLAGVAAAGLGNVLVTEQRAQSAADGAAHAAVGELIGDPRHDEIAVLVWADAGACWWAASPRYGVQGARFDDRCRPAREAADAVVRKTPSAQLLSLAVVADARDNQGGSTDPGRLEVLARVALDRRMPVLGRACDELPGSRSTVCFAVAWSGAQEV